MKGELLIQNVFYLFVVAIILEACVMAIFSMTAIRDISENKPVQTARDVVILLLSFALCYKVEILTIFRGTGIQLPHLMDVVISGLVLTRLTNMVKDFFEKLRSS